MDRYNMTGHKLWWHLDRVNQWLAGERPVPLHMDIGISKGCTIGCVYCYGVTQGRIGPGGNYIPREPLLRFMRDAAGAGIQAISITGEAEPAMNPSLYDAVAEGRRSGLDLGLATWGGMLKKERLTDLAENLTWIRFNISAGDEVSYVRIHRTSGNNFHKVIKNIEKIVNIKKQNNLSVTIGLQMVMMPWYAEESVKLANMGAGLGVDYLEIKHCSDTPDGKLGVDFDNYKPVEDMLKKAEEYTSDGYDVIVRWDKILNGKKRNYDKCYCAGNFMLRMSGDGTIYPCAQFFDWRSDEFGMGNITRKSLKDILDSNIYREVIRRVQALDVHKECYSGCKENAINEFLWMIKHPAMHVNFV